MIGTGRFTVVAGLVALAGLAAFGSNSAVAQVHYQPYAPTPYGYPVPYGFLQPDETLGTSPSFEIFPYAQGRQPVARVVRRCQYPDGWNSTDFIRDVNGIPAGIHHTCPAPARVRARARR